MTAGWKGEHLIRAVRPASTAGHNLKAARAGGGGRRCPIVAKRRNDVRAFHAEGLTVTQIAGAMSLGEATVRDDQRRMGLAANRKRRATG
jgi:DNA-binding NarL/FixJ family response regulator